jgi:hypothetical protein
MAQRVWHVRCFTPGSLMALANEVDVVEIQTA